MSTRALPPAGSIPSHALEALQLDALLPICTACGTQYPSPRDHYPRQFVPPSGQTWTTLADLAEPERDEDGNGHGHVYGRRNTILEDELDARVEYIQTEPGFGINQTPTLIHTAHGAYIWDCAAFLSTALVAYLLDPSRDLKGIAISHPHYLTGGPSWTTLTLQFFSTSLTWSRALRVPLYLNADDKEWYQRLGDIGADDQVEWWTGERELGPGVRVIQCGGHFPGSSVLHWDRLLEPAPSRDNLPMRPTPVSGLLLTADTVMVQPHQRGFAFLWSAPNRIPLDPYSTLDIFTRLHSVPSGTAASSWPGLMVPTDARAALEASVRAHLASMGWRWLGGERLEQMDREDIGGVLRSGGRMGVEEGDDRSILWTAGVGGTITGDAASGVTRGSDEEEQTGPREVEAELGPGPGAERVDLAEVSGTFEPAEVQGWRGPGVVLSSLMR